MMVETFTVVIIALAIAGIAITVRDTYKED